jgi:hypothetical protein
MKKINSIVLKIYLFGLPVIIIMGMLLYPYNNFQLADYAPVLNSIIGVTAMVWLALSIYLSIQLITSETLREKLLLKLTFIKERDEREERLTGKATRSTFLATIAVLITLFFFSCLQFSVYRVDPQYAVGGKTGFVTVGFGLYLSNEAECNKNTGIPIKKNIFSYKGLPVSSTVIIFFLVLWHIVYYNLSMKRFLKQ